MTCGPCFGQQSHNGKHHSVVEGRCRRSRLKSFMESARRSLNPPQRCLVVLVWPEVQERRGTVFTRQHYSHPSSTPVCRRSSWEENLGLNRASSLQQQQCSTCHKCCGLLEHVPMKRQQLATRSLRAIDQARTHLCHARTLRGFRSILQVSNITHPSF